MFVVIHGIESFICVDTHTYTNTHTKQGTYREHGREGDLPDGCTLGVVDRDLGSGGGHLVCLCMCVCVCVSMCQLFV